MIEIKAFINRNTVAKVVHALGKAGYKNLSVIDVKGTLMALSDDEQEYSIEIAAKIGLNTKSLFSPYRISSCNNFGW